ncbi:MAG: hypothetical protein ACRD0U_05540, partial [Acidimicrobiales bacterium]
LRRRRPNISTESRSAAISEPHITMLLSYVLSRVNVGDGLANQWPLEVEGRLLSGQAMSP